MQKKSLPNHSSDRARRDSGFRYRSGTREAVELAVAEWLKKTTAGLELERAEWAKACDFPEVYVQAKFVHGI